MRQREGLNRNQNRKLNVQQHADEGEMKSNLMQRQH